MIRRIAVAVAVAGAVVGLAASSAFAHVSVQPGEAPKGSYAQLSFRVPNETEDKDTTELKVQLPTDHPFASVAVKPMTGWTITTKSSKLATPLTSDDGQVTEAVSEITWSGGKLEPGQYDDFSISVGPLPDDVDSLTFKAIQTYSDGSEVAWIEATPAGGEEPEHPAPVLTLTASTGDEHGSGGSTETTVADEHGGDETAAPSTALVSKDDVDSASSKATIALVVGAIALIAGIAGLALGRKGSGSSE